MNKFIDADLLRTEIERRKEQHQRDYESGDITEFHRIVEDDAIVGIIDSLQPATAVGKVFTNTDPKNLYVESDKWDALLGQFENGQRVRIILVKEDAE